MESINIGIQQDFMVIHSGVECMKYGMAINNEIPIITNLSNNNTFCYPAYGAESIVFKALSWDAISI